MMKKLLLGLTLMLVFFASPFATTVAGAAADLDINSPAVTAIQASMQARHNQLLPHYNTGAVGLTGDAFIAVKDAAAVPLKDRGGLTGLVKDENADRANLYKELAAANGHHEWQGEIQQTFAGRWIDKAQAGWFYQKAGAWVKK
jgi:uncharacterized protein